MRAHASILAVALAAAVLAPACGGKAVFRLSSDENNAYELGQALARRQLPAEPTPVNDAHEPRVFALTAGKPRTIVAYDLASGNALWRTDADVQSRIVVGGDFIVAMEGTDLVARDQARGAPRWHAHIPGQFLGAAADHERAYVVYKTGDRSWLAAYSGTSGDRLWADDAAGALGAPAAHGGVVYVPFLSQWLSIVDGKTGQQLTRLRSDRDQISTLRVTSQRAYYGSKRGMFELSSDSAHPTSSPPEVKVRIPEQLERTTYGRDAYDSVQIGYTAADRARVWWGDDGYTIHYFRFVLGFTPDGELRWAYSHPRVELVASADTGHVVVGLAQNGDIVALEPSTGAVRARKSLGTTAPVLGATFDADGWSPSQQSEPVETVPALVAIARDHDARFDRVKELAVSALAKLPGPEVTTQLLDVLADDRAPQRLKDAVVDLLVLRHDPESLPVLTAQLGVTTDFLAHTRPDALGPVAKAIAGLGGAALAPSSVTAALAALRVHLDAASTDTDDLVLVIAAMAAIGNGAERGALDSHLLLYHSDGDLGGDASWQQAIVGALVSHGGPGERELLRQVAADPRTQHGLAEAIRDTLHD